MVKKRGAMAKQRRKHGARGGPNKRGSYPLASRRQAMSAIKLRGHARSRKNVLDRVSRWANAHNDSGVKGAVKRARERDRKRR